MTTGERVLAGEQDTVCLAQRLAAAVMRLRPDAPLLIYLEGELGAGKTTLSRALLEALGWEGPVPSPTYSLFEPYETGLPALPLVLHLDLYRLADPAELEFLGLRDYLGSPSLWLVEWPQHGRGFLPAPDLVLTLKHGGGDARCLRLTACSARGQRLQADANVS